MILDWSDPEIFKEIVRRRIIKSSGLDGDFESLWRMIFESHVRGEESFAYILARTLMRPREVLRFCRTCLDVAVSRGKDRISEVDILQAELICSADALADIRFELKDVAVSLERVPDVFHRASLPLARDEVENRIQKLGLTGEETSRAIELLIWFGFLGYWSGPDVERFSHQYEHDLQKMNAGLQLLQQAFTVHPAFRSALECVGTD